ncbi:protein vav isoform X2 [Topomyia yanbarensis]|uniref:protein vav isoform X2 n=1 Tax=Topomyia yanbarensis TaxID=2498891 RepID=UPI00273BD7A9|nr:protein vav isoform X2 [Topomyia yanbarensis]
MAEELWRECAAWLTRCKVIPVDHKANQPESDIKTLAAILRDGVLLCNLLIFLDPSVFDMKDFNRKPQMAHFLCIQNIKLFLDICKSNFGLKDADIFEPTMLYDLTNFHRVLLTLSKLSQSRKTHLSHNIIGFDSQLTQSDKSSSDEDIYRDLHVSINHSASTNEIDAIEIMVKSNNNLKGRRCIESQIFNDIECGTSYDSIAAGNETIYEDLCCVTFSSTLPKLAPTTNFEQRDFVLKELVETESNYLEALIALKCKFMQPLEKVLTKDVLRIIFPCIKELVEIHEKFLDKLRGAVQPDSKIKLSAVFLEFREPFLIYGDYCSCMTNATDMLRDVCKKSSNVVQAVNSHDDFRGLERAKEAMVDVAQYSNEVKRDSEHLVVIQKVKEGQYMFRVAYNLQEYRVEICHSRRTLGRDARLKYSLLLARKTQSTAFTLYMKTEEERDKWKRTFDIAMDVIEPIGCRNTDHKFSVTTFDAPFTCRHCSKFLKGKIHQGYRCRSCEIAVHKGCISSTGRCNQNQFPPPVCDRLLSEFNWFVGSMDRDVATSQLEKKKIGTYLLRVRPQGASNSYETIYALSLKTDSKITKHMKIYQKQDSLAPSYYLSTRRYFKTIIELVSFYERNDLGENFAGLNQLLQWPFKELVATALYDFTPSEPNQLPLKQGCQVIVIGKEGDGKGWWRGKTLEKVGFFPKEYVRENHIFINEH